jgi:hypothetical protein
MAMTEETIFFPMDAKRPSDMRLGRRSTLEKLQPEPTGLPPFARRRT